MSTLLALVMHIALHAGVDGRVVATIVQMESDWDAAAIGASGEVGLMQIIPMDGRPTAIQLSRPDINVHTGCSILAANLRYFDGDLQSALVAYNMGIGGLAERGLDDPAAVRYLSRFEETWRVLWPDEALPWE